MNELCMMCTSAVPSPHHTEHCLSKSKEELIAIANGHIRAAIRHQRYSYKLADMVTLFQGKFTIVKEENNKLRNKLRNTLEYNKELNQQVERMHNEHCGCL